MWQTLRGCGVQGSIRACGVEGYDFAFACDDGDGYLYWQPLQKRGDLQPFYVWFCLGSFFFVSWQLVLFLLLAYCEPPKGGAYGILVDFFGYWAPLCLQRISSAILLRSFSVKLSLCLCFGTSLLIQVHEFVLWELIFQSKQLCSVRTKIASQIES